MKKLLGLLIILLILTMAGCKSPPKNEIVLPPFPERQEQQMPEDLKDVVSEYRQKLVRFGVVATH